MPLIGWNTASIIDSSRWIGVVIGGKLSITRGEDGL